MTERHTLPLPDLFDLLADDSRRSLLAALQGRSRPVRVADLATELAGPDRADETDRGNETVRGDQIDRGDGDPDAGPEPVEQRRERLRVHLYHVHVPKLADAGVVDHDRETNVVELTPEGEAVAETVLARLDGLEAAVTPELD